MRPLKPSLTIGIEEEYLLVDPTSRDLVSAPDPGFMPACKAALGEQVTHELLQSQVEIGTKPCATAAKARADLARLRGTVAEIAQRFGMAMIASSTHPFAAWDEQRSTDMDRYRLITRDYQALARRQVISGMHVHACVEDEELRIDLMGQITYFLPHLLALSCSSPFWRGQDTGLKAFRPTIFGDLPRSGLPERFASWGEWLRLLDILNGVGLVDDPSKIWWDVRPSVRHPTLELRLTDICTSLDDAVALAALYQALLHRMWRLRDANLTWRCYRNILIEENKWRAQRHGAAAELADYGAGRLKPLAELVEELIELVREDARALDCLTEVERVRDIVAGGTSADHQCAVYRRALEAGADEPEALRSVVDWLISASLEGLPAR